MQLRAGAGAGASALLLLTATAPPTDAWTALLPRSTSADPTTAVVAAAILLAWVLALWLLGAVAVAAASGLPGAAGRAGGAVARRVAPASVRRIVELTLGVTLTATLPPAVPAFAATSATSAPAAASAEAEGTDLLRGHPAARPASHPTGGFDWPLPAAPGPVGAGGVREPVGERPVVVRPGSCLWHLAAAQLEAEGAGVPTAAQVARAWPRWWATNRDVIGDDPDLLHPGMRLSPPPGD